MDLRQRINDPEENLRAAIEQHMARMWTSAPGKVVSYDAAKQTVSVQLAVKSFVKSEDGSQKAVDIPVLQDVPVQFPAGGGVSMTFPVKPGDECLVHFTSRSPDTWQQSGGEQVPPDAGMHSLSNGFAMLGFRSTPRALENAHTSATQIRSDDGRQTITLDPASGMTLASEGVSMVMTSAGVAFAGGTITHNGQNIGSTHVHGGIVVGGADTQGPH